MRRAISQQMGFGDGFIDPSLYQLNEELKKVDELLSQGPLLKPFEELFDENMGRPGTPAGIYLRMMYLKAPVLSGSSAGQRLAGYRRMDRLCDLCF